MNTLYPSVAKSVNDNGGQGSKWPAHFVIAQSRSIELCHLLNNE